MQAIKLPAVRRQRGLAMVEFAITVPLLLLLLLAFGELGRLLFQYNELVQASRDSSRYLSAQAWNRTLGRIDLNAGLLAQTRNLAVYGSPSASGEPRLQGLDGEAVEIAPVGANHVRVTLRYAYQPVIGNGLPALVGEAIPLQLTLQASTVMRAL
ncbi:TadE/TadG family type IV pilus assembly protein [Pseudomonas oligotrophica]|uniref:TadE/TadG family type IV pilus assembly protein n=1 Tax=Pseudomonas oligotrophica TaxID=2912055 RepID=UPI001F36F323|nr:TadE/TadG family type IV pilus assembly protein [Pseudomonas oligotrophica]MCF7202879.1 pilus assembly protein [Pseudomonas oligotrophica]